MTDTPLLTIQESQPDDEHWQYMQANRLDWFGKQKYKNIDEWREAKKKEGEEIKRLTKIEKLKKAAMLGIDY